MLTPRNNRAAAGTHYLSIFRIFEFQVSRLLHPSIWMIPQPYHLHPANSEHVWHYILLWTVVLQNKACQTVCYITCRMCSFSQPIYLTLILHLLVIATNIRCLNKSWLLPCKLSFFWGGGRPFKITALDLPKLSFMALRLKRLEMPSLS